MQLADPPDSCCYDGCVDHKKNNLNDLIDAIQLEYLWNRQAEIEQAAQQNPLSKNPWMTENLTQDRMQKAKTDRLG